MSWLTDPAEWEDEPSATRAGRPRQPESGGPGGSNGGGPGGSNGGGPGGSNGGGSRGKLIAAVVAGWLAVSVVVLLVLLAVRGPGSNNAADSTRPSGAATSGGGASGSPLPAGWQRRASDDQTNCAAHSYGQVPAFFARHPCERVHRELLTTTATSGRPIVMASYLITFSQDAIAQQFNALVTSDGTGNVSDLVRDGAGFTGSPKQLPPAAFFSAQSGTQVRVAEAAYVSGASDPNDSVLKTLAQQAVSQLG